MPYAQPVGNNSESNFLHSSKIKIRLLPSLPFSPPGRGVYPLFDRRGPDFSFHGRGIIFFLPQALVSVVSSLFPFQGLEKISPSWKDLSSRQFFFPHFFPLFTNRPSFPQKVPPLRKELHFFFCVPLNRCPGRKLFFPCPSFSPLDKLLFSPRGKLTPFVSTNTFAWFATEAQNP